MITIAAKKDILKARAGVGSVPKIVGFVFGDGGVNPAGRVLEVDTNASALNNEVLRKPYEKYTVVSETEYRYECSLAENELTGKKISEIGLYDSEGKIVHIKHMLPKVKDADIKMTFHISDTF